MPCTGRNSPSRGFTLIEVVVAIAIVAVLAAFAVPSYRSYVERVNRLTAVAALYRAAQYVDAFGDAPPTALPEGVNRAPESGKLVYVLRIRFDDARGGYALEARPAADGAMVQCGTTDAASTCCMRTARARIAWPEASRSMAVRRRAMPAGEQASCAAPGVSISPAPAAGRRGRRAGPVDGRHGRPGRVATGACVAAPRRRMRRRASPVSRSGSPPRARSRQRPI